MAPIDSTAEKRTGGPFATVLKNVTSNWASLLVNTVVSFVLAPVVVHSLGSVQYGIWALVMQFTGYLWLLDFGVRESVVKYVAEYHASGQEDRLRSTIGNAISIYLVVTLVAFVAIVALSMALPYLFNIPAETRGAAQLTAFLVGATVAQSFLTNVFVGVLMGLQRTYLVARSGILFSLVRAIATFALLRAGYGIVALSLLNLALSLVSGWMVFHLCRVYLPTVPFRPVRPVRDEVRRLLNYGKYVLLANIGDKVVFVTDGIVIGMFLPIAMLTPYAIAGTLITQMRMVVIAMSAIFNPLTSALQSEKRSEQLAPVVIAGCKAAMLVGNPICIGFMTLGERFVQLWMGTNYSATAGQILIVLSLGYIVGQPYQTISGAFYGLGEHRPIAILRIVEGVANLALSVVLIQTIGLVGVALGTAIPHMIVVGGVLPRMLPRMFSVGLRDYYADVYLKPLAASVPFALTCWAIEHVIVPGTLVSFFAWGTASLAMYVIPCWLIALSASERTHVLEGLARRIPRLLPAPAAGGVPRG
jgi:O-antigen/teichoic acid export membrane protein